MQEAARQSLAALGKGHAPKRPRLVIHCEASIIQEMPFARTRGTLSRKTMRGHGMDNDLDDRLCRLETLRHP
jgi:hypothetical protein